MDEKLATERDLEKLEDSVQERHRENESRFSKIESKLAETAGMLRLAIAILVANGAINFYAAFHPKG
jgi:hypothetical protein